MARRIIGDIAGKLNRKTKGRVVFKLRDRTGRYAYAGGRRKPSKVDAITKYHPTNTHQEQTGFSAKPPKRRFTVAKLGKAARYAFTHPKQAKYFLDNHYLAKAARSRLSVPFRNVRDTIGENIPQGIRTRNRQVHNVIRDKVLNPTAKYRKKLGDFAHQQWSDPGTRVFTIIGGYSLIQLGGAINRRREYLQNKNSTQG